MSLRSKFPNFTLPSTSGDTISLQDILKNVRGAVITSFPLAFTGN
ncbi:MAG: redoxin domain-containing protein [Bacillaceae bacterium]|nr:redoxin domain-containing protein [Bacillaceae bacterium]